MTRNRKRHKPSRPRPHTWSTPSVQPWEFLPVMSHFATQKACGHARRLYFGLLDRARTKFYRFTTTPDWAGHKASLEGAHLAHIEARRHG